MDSTAPATASVTAPVNGNLYRASSVPATFSGRAADNSTGAGLNANSTTFTLQRPDGLYWNSTTLAWQSAVFNLATIHIATTDGTTAGWTNNATLPGWATNSSGTYTVHAKATDKAGNTSTGTAVSFTLVAPIAPTAIGTLNSDSTSLSSFTQAATVAASNTVFVTV